MKTIIKSRKQATSFNETLQDHIIISIHIFGYEKSEVIRNEFTKGVLFLAFNDENELYEMPDGKKIFNKHMARAIINFVLKDHKSVAENGVIVVHCDVGLSRSPAVAAALHQCVGDSDIHIFDNRRYYPDMFVYRTILNEMYNNVSLL